MFWIRKDSAKHQIVFWVREYNISNILKNISFRGGEWYLEKRGSRKILVGSRNIESIFDQSRSLVLAWFVFTFFESRNFLPKSLGVRFLTRISASRRLGESRILPFATPSFVFFFASLNNSRQSLAFRQKLVHPPMFLWIL